MKHHSSSSDRWPFSAGRAGLTLAALIGLGLAPVPATAHEGETPYHYVSEDGRDEGTCAESASPCRTIAYALSQAGKGDEVRVAAGTYAFQPDDPAEIVQLLSPIVAVRGGFDAEGSFARQDIAAHPTILVGPEARHARQLEERGLLVQAQAEGQALAARGVTRYVAPDGEDVGDCTDLQAPCESITFALDQAQAGDTVLIASGDYAVPPDAAEALLRPDITVRGGYIEEPSFLAAAPATRPSYVVGPSHEHRAALEERGLTLVQDRKGAAIEEAMERAPAAALAAAQPATPCDPATGMAGPFPCRGVDLLAHMPLASFSSRPRAGNDVWGFVDRRDGREYAFIGLFNGTAVVDVSDPRNPREVGTIAGQNARWRDIKVYQFQDGNERWQAYAYVTADFPDAPQGLQIVDLSGLPDSIALAATYDGIRRAHNVYIANVDYATGEALPGLAPYAFILGSDKAGGAAHALDLANPTAPIEVLTPLPGTQYAHDAASLTVTDARAAVCRSGLNPPDGGHNPCELLIDFNEDTLDLWDVTDKSRPLRLSSTPYADASYTHSGWPSQDGRFVFLHDELDEQDRGLNTTVRTFDISDLRRPVLTNVWSGPERNIDHNGFVVGDRYYMSAYRRGMMVLDIADPNDPEEIAFFDTFPSPAENSAMFNGAWGVYPFLPSGTLLVSDVEGGLYVLRQSGAPEPPPEQAVVAYEYPVKLVCGVQKEFEDERLARGAYGTVINIANLNTEAVRFTKRLALTVPPGDQRPGRTAPIGEDALDPDQALKSDCAEIVGSVFGGRPPANAFEGFVVIRSRQPLEVSAVYAASALEEAGVRVGGDVDVETIAPRLIRRGAQ